MNQKYIISIGRQLGSGGRDIGKIIADTLGFSFYDKELINHASRESGISKNIFEKADEKNTFSLLSSFLGVESSTNYLNSEALFKIQSNSIEKIAEENSCVFIGRCADYILREHPNIINIFVTANNDDRALRTATRLSISEKEAEAENKRIDRKRKEYYNFYTNRYWGRAHNYDLCINSSILKDKGTADFIVEFFKQKFKF